MKAINANTVLGLLGSGQLSRMTAKAAYNLGIQVHILCNASPTEVSPAEQIAHKVTKAAFIDQEKILAFAKTCDFISLENEFIDQKILDLIENTYPGKLYPSNKTFKLIGDKLTEKKTFKNAGIQVVPYAQVDSTDDLKKFILLYDYPVVLKTSKGGYDGFGNYTVKAKADIELSFKKLAGEKNNQLLVEKYIPYVKELAIIACASKTETVFYPIVETLQENHICHFVKAPADISKNVETLILEYTQKALKAIGAQGLFAFEFFLTADQEIYLNESAPRPHNSGHYTMKANKTSQFENHVRSVLNLPLGSTELIYPQTVMLNLLGTTNQVAELKPFNDFLKIKNSHLELYGKIQSKPGRKMGHFILCGDNSDQLMSQAQKLKANYTL